MRRLVVAAGIVAAVALALVLLVYTGVVMPTRLFAAKYDVRGVDVSHHNGTVDWARVAEQDIDFNPIWFRSVAWPPLVPDGRDWTLWQYSNRDRLDGVGSDDEAYVDMNVLSDDTDLDELTVG